MKKTSIRTRLVFLLTVCLTIMVTIITVINLRMYENKLETIYLDNTAEKIELLNMYIDNYLDTPIALVESTAKDITALSDVNELHEDLLLRANSIKETLGLHVAFEGDPVLYSSGETVTDADYNSNERQWYKDSMTAPAKVIITAPYLDALTGEKIISVSKALANGQGVVVLDLKLSFLDAIVSKVTIGQEGYSFVLDNEGNVLYHPTYGRDDSLVENDVYEPFINNEFIETTIAGEKTFLIRYYNEKMNWQIGSIFTSKEIDAIYKPLILPSISINAICVLILAIVFFFLLTRVLRPLKTLNAVAQDIAQGDLRQQVKVKSHDEIGQLSASFNGMTDGLKSMIVQVDSTSAKLTNFSTDVSASVEENVQSISQVVQNIHNVTDQTQEQLQAAQNVNDSIYSIGEEVTVISSNMEDVHIASTTAEQQTTAGVQSMDHVMKQMTAIETNTKETTENFNTLVSVASEIDTFSKAISGIAGQTNLLALNASIEAARAGEHGKGFAVVAEEVRKLAEQTNEAANEIQSLVSTIQQTGDVAKASIDSNNAAVQAGLQQIDETAKVFHSIHDTMASLADKINTTQLAIGVLQTRKQEAMASADEITQASRAVSDHVEQVAATTEEQNASMEQMAVSAEHLAKQAQELQQTIQRFTY